MFTSIGQAGINDPVSLGSTSTNALREDDNNEERPPAKKEGAEL